MGRPRTPAHASEPGPARTHQNSVRRRHKPPEKQRLNSSHAKGAIPGWGEEQQSPGDPLSRSANWGTMPSAGSGHEGPNLKRTRQRDVRPARARASDPLSEATPVTPDGP